MKCQRTQIFTLLKSTLSKRKREVQYRNLAGYKFPFLLHFGLSFKVEKVNLVRKQDLSEIRISGTFSFDRFFLYKRVQACVQKLDLCLNSGGFKTGLFWGSENRSVANSPTYLEKQ